MPKKKMAALAAFATLMLVVSVRAESPQVAAASCIPVSGPLRVSANKISFNSGHTGTIVLHCQMNHAELVEADVDNNVLVATYRDSGGDPATGQVKISLVGAAKGSGAKISALQFNSNAAPAKPGVADATGATPPEILTDFYYLMRVELHRVSTAQTVELYGFSYEQPPIQ